MATAFHKRLGKGDSSVTIQQPSQWDRGA